MLCIAGCDSTPALEVQEGIFYEMSQFIELFIVFTLLLSIFLWRNDGRHTLRNSLFYNGINIISAIRQQCFRNDAIYQERSLRTISGGTLSDNDSDRHTMRIHGQVYFGIEPPFVRLIS